MSIDAIAWHDRSLDNHRSETSKAAAAGYRGVSLSVYGTPQDPRYAAVMVRRPIIHAALEWDTLSLDGWQQKFSEMAGKGFGPYLVSATGPTNAPLIAAVFRPMATTPLTRHGINAQQLAALNYQAWCDGLIPASVDAYGAPGDVRFIATWHPNTRPVAWNLNAMNPSDMATRQAMFDAINAQGGRPVFTVPVPGGQFFGLFVDDQVGSWHSKTNIDSAGYQSAYNLQTAAGRQPVRVMAEGSGAGARFAVVFAEREDPVAREWHADGKSTVAGIDAAMQKFMQAQGMRGASLAITYGTRLVYAKGYTWAEPGYPRTQPETLFRIASVSKLFAAASIHRMIQEQVKAPNGKPVTLDTTMQSILSLKTPTGGAPADPRFNDVTIRHLLESTSSIDQGLLWSHPQAAAAFKAPLPCTPEQLASYCATAKLGTPAPGDHTNEVYGNTDYFLLSQVIRKLAGTTTFEAALDKFVLTPLKITRVRGSRSLLADQLPGEARHHERLIDPIQETDSDGKLVFNADGSRKFKDWPQSMFVDKNYRAPGDQLVPHAYGTDNYEILDGCGGLSAAVTDIARLVASMNLTSANPVFSAATLETWFKAAVASSAYTGPDAHGRHGLDWGAFWEPNAPALKAGNFHAAKGGWLPSHGTGVEFTIGGFGFFCAGNDGGQPDVKIDWFRDSDGDGAYDAKGVLGQAVAQGEWNGIDLFPDYQMASLAAAVPPKPGTQPSSLTPALVLQPAQQTGARTLDATRQSVLHQRASAMSRHRA